MSTFQNIKLVCTVISKLNAQDLAKQRGWDFPDNSDVEIYPIISKKKELEEMLKNRGFLGAHGSTRSGAPDQDGNWIEFIALTQVINKKAPEFRNILNEISRTFKIETMDQKNISVVEVYDKKSSDLIKTVNYFISSEHTYAVNLNEKKIMKIEGRQTGGAGKEEHGAYVEFNVEIVPDKETIIHELIHLKWPEEMPQIEETVDNISKRIAEKFKKQEYYDLLNDPRIEEERKKIIEAFELLDADLAYLINNT